MEKLQYYLGIELDTPRGDLELTVRLFNTQSRTEIALCQTLYKNCRKQLKPYWT